MERQVRGEWREGVNREEWGIREEWGGGGGREGGREGRKKKGNELVGRVITSMSIFMAV